MFDTGAQQWNVVRLRDDARKELLEGLKVVAEAVGGTLGPRGRCVLIQKPDCVPIITKDGVSVAKAINLRDPAQRAGAELIREAASRTAEVAGDGTTTSTVLAYAMVTEGMKAMERSFNPTGVKRGIDKAVDVAVTELRRMSMPVSADTRLEQIATISANGDAFIGGLIAAAVKKVGKEGIVTVDDAKGASTALEFVEGMQVPTGWLNSYFVTHPEKMHAILENCLVLVCDQKVSAARDLIPVLEHVQKSGRPLLIIAEDVEGEALQTLIVNKLKGIISVAAIKAPGWGTARQELLKDIAVITGANVVSPSLGLELSKTKLTDLGEVKRVTIEKQVTTFVATGKTETAVQARVKELQGRLADAVLVGDDRTGLLERVGKMTAGAAVIKVGGMTEIEVKEKRDRIDDAICATRAALEEGVVPGGGVALLRVSQVISSAASMNSDESEAKGMRIVSVACRAPITRIASNAGVSGDVVIDHISNPPLDSNAPERSFDFFGWNAATDKYCDMLDAGIIDPAKVARCALQHAASVAGIFLTLDAAILEDVGQRKDG